MGGDSEYSDMAFKVPNSPNICLKSRVLFTRRRANGVFTCFTTYYGVRFSAGKGKRILYGIVRMLCVALCALSCCNEKDWLRSHSVGKSYASQQQVRVGMLGH